MDAIEIRFNNQPFSFFIVTSKFSTHIVAYNSEAQKYFCGCADFLIRKRKSGGMCKHIKFVDKYRRDVHV